jgi:hypothetical protein
MTARSFGPLFLALGLGAFLLGACHQVSKENRLILTLTPDSLTPGTKVEVMAVPQVPVVLQSVSGTVAVTGAWVVPFAYDASRQAWIFKTIIPSMISIPSGKYEVKAWGLTAQGTRVEGSTIVNMP